MADPISTIPSRGWAPCTKCNGLVWTDGASICPAGGTHQPGTQRFLLRAGDAFARGDMWQACANCGCMFQPQPSQDPLSRVKTLGTCPAGGPHKPFNGPSYTLGHAGDIVNPPVNMRANTDWSRCTSCQTLVIPEGLCPSTHAAHTPIHLNFPSTPNNQILEWLDYSPWEKILQPATAQAWPAFNSGEEAFAYQEFSTALSGTTRGQDIRATYTQLDGNQFSDMLSDLNSRWVQPPPSGVSQQVWTEVHTQLQGELEAVGNIWAHFDNLRLAIDEVFLNETWITARVVAIFGAENNPETHPGFPFLDLIFAILEMVAGALTDGIGAGLLAMVQMAIQSAIDATRTSIGEAANAKPEDWTGRDPFLVTVSDIFNLLSEKFANVHDALDDTKTSILGDWGRLQAANLLPLLEDSSMGPLSTLWQSAYRVSLYQILFPLKFGLWSVAGEVRLPPSGNTNDPVAVGEWFDNLNTQFAYTARDFHVVGIGSGGKHYDVDSLDVLVKLGVWVQQQWQIGTVYPTPNPVIPPDPTIFPSLALMNELLTPDQGPAINLAILFDGGGGWEGLPIQLGKIYYFDSSQLWMWRPPVEGRDAGQVWVL